MKEYKILAGKIRDNGNGDYTLITQSNVVEEAYDLFNKQVQYEQSTLDGWCLTKYEHVEVVLEEHDGENIKVLALEKIK